ncbi:MAG: beta strand repeat-containing protein, partial [Ferruginibacter sp.]
GLTAYGPNPFTATTSSSDVTVVGLTRAAGIGTTPTAAGNAWGGTDFNQTSAANAITNNDFVTFSITPGVGKVLSFNNIPAYNIRRSSNGATTGRWQYQIGSGSFVDLTSDITWGAVTSATGNLQAAINLSTVNDLQNVAAGTTITFRILLWGGTTGSWYINNISGNDLAITGYISSLPIVTLPTVTSIETDNAVLGATVAGDAISARGTVWGTATDPTTNALAEGSTTTGAFSHTRSSLTPNTLYYFRGYATNTAGTAYSTTANFTTKHNAPVIENGSGATINSIVANWSAPLGTVGSETFTYEIEVDDNNDFSSVVFTQNSILSSTTNITVGGLNDNTNYYFRVRANNAGGSSAWSSTSTAYATLLATSPSISVSGTLTALTTIYGTASTNTSFTVAGATLNDVINIAAPSGFEVSTSNNSGFASSINLTPISNAVSSTLIYVRLAATTNAGNYSGNIAITSTGADPVSVPTVSSTVNPKALTINGLTAVDKTYDRNNTATVNGTPIYVGLENGESYNVTDVVSFSYPLVTFGTQTLVLSTPYTAPTSNYTVTQPILSATINKKALTITNAQAQNKGFDGTVAATITGTLNGVISPDVVTLVGTGTFNDATIGNNKPVTSTSTLSGADAANYSLTQPTGLTANIVTAACNQISGNAVWNFTTAAPSSNPFFDIIITSLTNGNNLVATALITGTSVSNNSGASGGNNAGVAARTGALTLGANGSAYFEFTLTPNTNYGVTLSAINFGTRSTNSGPTNFTIRSSVDGYTADLITGSIPTISTWVARGGNLA